MWSWFSSLRRLPPSVPQVILSTNHARSANVIIRQHGEDAPIEAAMSADAMLESGDLDGYAVWRRIVKAVEEIQRTKRDRCEVAH